jgi:hypothetical protein
LLFFSLGGEARLRSLLETADFRDVEICDGSPSAGSPGQAFISLLEEVRRAVREKMR